MASTKFQLEESKKPNPRYVLDLHSIRGMIQEADDMDKDLRAVLSLKLEVQENPPHSDGKVRFSPVQSLYCLNPKLNHWFNSN
jgi:hypothetical protein